MRKILSLVLLAVALHGVVSGQEWNFIKSNERYHFQNEEDDRPFDIIFADSVVLAVDDSVYYLNRLFLPCDTCSGHYDEKHFLANQANFLGRQLSCDFTNSTVFLQVSATAQGNKICLPGSKKEEWWFDEDSTLLARLDTILYQDVLGIYDSVAIISIDNEPKIGIAKSVGLIKYFDYQLTGLQYEGRGELLATWKDVYDYQSGDVLYAYTHEDANDGPYFSFDITKITIDDVSKTDSQYRYYTTKQEVSWDGYEDKYYYTGEYADTLVYSEKDFPSDYYPNQVIITEFEISGETYEKFEQATFGDEDGLFGLEVKKGMFYEKDSWYYGELTHPDLYVRNLNWYDCNTSYSYRFGLGYDEYYTCNMFFSNSNGIVGAIRDGVALGWVPNDSIFVEPDIVSIFEVNFQKIKITPNPSKGQLYFDLSKYEQAQVRVYTLQGQEVEQFTIEHSQSKDLQYLKAGIYLVMIEVVDGIKQIKWVKE